MLPPSSCAQEQDVKYQRPTSYGDEISSRQLYTADDDFLFDEVTYVKELAERFKPMKMTYFKNNYTMKPQQLFHLHHMKTAGTSMDDLIHCAQQRLLKQRGLHLPYYEVHECDPKEYNDCLYSNKKSARRCRKKINQASVLSYCAPFSDLHHFNWTDEHILAFTVLRKPIDRVWSMYRYQTKECYQCHDLQEVYESIEKNTTSEDFPKIDEVCFQQLQNHQVRNLLSDPSKPDWLEQAKRNLRTHFTMIGLTEDLSTTHEILSSMIPWAGKEYRVGGDGDDDICELPHSNASPTYNGCGKQGHHKPLPDRPNRSLHYLIAKYNQLDLELYQYAQELFEYQKRAHNLGANLQ